MIYVLTVWQNDLVKQLITNKITQIFVNHDHEWLLKLGQAVGSYFGTKLNIFLYYDNGHWKYYIWH